MGFPEWESACMASRTRLRAFWLFSSANRTSFELSGCLFSLKPSLYNRPVGSFQVSDDLAQALGLSLLA